MAELTRQTRVIGIVMGSSSRPVHPELTEPQLEGIRAHNELGRKAAMLDMVAAAINERATVRRANVRSR